MPSACPELAGGRRAREKPACLASQDMEKADVHVCSWAELFPLFFPSNLAPGLWDEIPPLAHPEQGLREFISHWRKPISIFPLPEGPEVSKTKPGCPTAIAEQPQPCVNSSHMGPLKSCFSKAHHNCAILPLHCPLLKMWSEPGFCLISDLVQARIPVFLKLFQWWTVDGVINPPEASDRGKGPHHILLQKISSLWLFVHLLKVVLWKAWKGRRLELLRHGTDKRDTWLGNATGHFSIHHYSPLNTCHQILHLQKKKEQKT